MSLDNAIWLAGILTEAAVVGILFYRRIWRTLPIFCAYLIWDVLSNAGAYLISRYHPASYFSAYFVETIVDSALQFCVLVELAWSVLRPVRSSLPRSSLVVVSVLILAAGAAIWPFAVITGIHASRQSLLLAQLQHTVSILRILFFLLLAAGSQLLSIGWRDRELQVATGLGFYSLANVAISIVQTHQSTTLQYVRLEQFVVASFLVSLVYWIVSFSQKTAERREFTPQMQNFLLAVAGAARSTRITLAESQSDKPQKRDRR
ncbi:MAG: hypothetical protein WAL45_05140 [Terracidiphilus sp.]